MIEMQYNFPLLAGQGEQWQERLRAAVDQLQPDNADELRPTFRMKRLEQRALAAGWLQSPPAQTWLTYGGHHGTLVALLAAGLAGKTVAVEQITYSGILDQGRLLGSKIAGVAFDAEGMLPDALRALCASEPVAAMYTMPTVHNPLGCVAGVQRRLDIVSVAREFDLLIVEDDAYGYMEPDPPPSYARLAPERTFFVRGLSKSYAPATLTGLLVAPERFSAGVEMAVKNSTTGTSLVHNAAALSLLADGSLDLVIEAKLVEGVRRNEAARGVLGEAAAPGVRSAWHLWVSLPGGMTAAEGEAACKAKGVLVSGGNWFTAPGAPESHAIRVGLGGEVEAARTQAGVEMVAEVIGR
jgi:DNA-binding transcriptional MocR family regulator